MSNSNKDIVEFMEDSNEESIKCSEDNEDKIKQNELENMESIQIQEPNKEPIGEESLEEVEFHLEDLNDSETIVIKNRNNVYYEMYKEARKKAKIARDLALSTYLEAKRIKNTYMLENLDDESDEEDESDRSDDSDEEDENENDDGDGYNDEN